MPEDIDKFKLTFLMHAKVTSKYRDKHASRVGAPEALGICHAMPSPIEI
jgi:hypothetical protein